ncbi:MULTISPECIES: hypothetical protein [Sphingomonadaceae]|uniref:hypothetical protein n=1 Tax=Sphingomonadales TaxID=204457 RepID=UPI00135CB194|nr:MULTISPECIES: hypothetical protein [Sphingomonadaceae]NBB42205.1 hypothetical protein [Sphingobium yanoikuyae]
MIILLLREAFRGLAKERELPFEIGAVAAHARVQPQLHALRKAEIALAALRHQECRIVAIEHHRTASANQ